ncbi:MAG: DnaJ domain-containing protein [Pseudobacter sp.]|uniref:DnaJ domain-containing protein n=1 Tax=Pseudobacter sp. TaxID=2045420 RepID=UPI003F81EEED
MNINKDYYAILELHQQATREQIREAYRRLAKLYHPDKNPRNPEAEEIFKEINEAHEVLANEVTRHIYDTQRIAKQEETKEEDAFEFAEAYAGNPRRPEKKSRERKHYVQREKRIYVYGILRVKFQGEPDLTFNEFSPHEQEYIIFPTESEATILESDLHINGTSREYDKTYSATELFKTPVPQPVHCCFRTSQGNEYYYLNIHDLRIADPRITDVIKHEKNSFGTLEGKLFGYILHSYLEEITETYAEFAGPTGNVETKEEGNAVYMRKQYYAADGSTYWREWTRDAHYTSRKYNGYQKQQQTSRYEDSLGNWWWVIVLLVLLAFFPPLFLIIGPFLGIYLGLLLLVLLIENFYKILPWIGGIFLLVLVVAGLFSGKRSPGISRTKRSAPQYDSSSSSRSVTGNDTLIRHFIRWQDRDSSRYALQVSIPASAITAAMQRHQQMDIDGYPGYKEVYNTLLNPEEGYMQPVASSFDSIARANNLNQLQTASMVVSCIQSLQYSLVLDKSCNDHYSDPFVNDYLLNCHTDCCKGHVKFGVQSPVEFMEDLKGDCDTKSLFLFAVLKRMGFKVALLTSEYYKHALIAVQLNQVDGGSRLSFDINGGSYYLWETTSSGFGPGELPASKSNLKHWNITLLQ